MKVIVPPIKSQGIKTKLVPWIRDLAPSGKRWVEPFLGTGVVAFNMRFEKALLCDTNPHIINFYQGIQNGKINGASVREYLETEGQNLAAAADHGYAHFRYIRDRFNEQHDPLDFLFLSRAGFNGMMRFNKRGGWNIPFCKKPNRFSKMYISKIVNQVKLVGSIIKDDWEFRCQPFTETLRSTQVGDVIYCDPPYYGRYVDYYNGWNEEDEAKLFSMLKEGSGVFILSTWHHNDYRENEMISKFWNQFNLVTKDHFYHSGAKEENRKSIVEALVFNFESQVSLHNHGHKEKPKQLSFFE